MSTHTGESEYHALQTQFTKRFSNRWQASATYTLSWLWNQDSYPFQRPRAGAVRDAARPRRRMGPLGRRPAPPVRLQRHLAGRLRLPGERRCTSSRAGNRLATNYGGDNRQFGGGSGRLRPDGTIVAAERLLRSGAEPHRPAAPAADSAGRAACRSTDRGNLQPVQPDQLSRSAPRKARPTTCSRPTGSSARRSSGSGSRSRAFDAMWSESQAKCDHRAADSAGSFFC